MKKSRIAIAAICVGLFLPAGVASAAPQDDPGSEQRTAAIAYYAETEGILIQDAGNVIDDQAAILSAANDMGFDFDDTESVRFESDGATQVAFVRSDSKAHISGIASVSISVNTTIVVDNSDVNPDVSLEVSDATVEEVKDIVPSVQGVYVRESDGALMIDAAPATDGVQARSSVQAIKVSGYPTAVVNYSGVASDSLSIRGGTGMSSCTAGFPAKYGSYKGFISAAHCPDST